MQQQQRHESCRAKPRRQCSRRHRALRKQRLARRHAPCSDLMVRRAPQVPLSLHPAQAQPQPRARAAHGGSRPQAARLRPLSARQQASRVGSSWTRGADAAARHTNAHEQRRSAQQCGSSLDDVTRQSATRPSCHAACGVHRSRRRVRASAVRLARARLRTECSVCGNPARSRLRSWAAAALGSRRESGRHASARWLARCCASGLLLLASNA
jgi:hypothetical protein